METFMIAAPGTTEILVIVFGILLLFGGKKIPEFARGLGKGLKEFRKASKEISRPTDDIENNPDSDKK